MYKRYYHGIQVLLYVLDGSQSSFVRRRARVTTQPNVNGSSSSSDSGSGTGGTDLADDLLALHRELRAYSPELAEKPAALFLNKCDLKGSLLTGNTNLLIFICIYVSMYIHS